MLEYFKERKDVFHDNDEIIDMLVWCKNEKCVDEYVLNEAMENLQGLYKLVGEMIKHLEEAA